MKKDNFDRLSLEEHNEIRDEIISLTLNDEVRQGKPVAIILAGQPGSGKSGATDAATMALKEEGRRPVIIDPDDLRIFHPRYETHAFEDPLTAADKVHPDASLWAYEVTSEAINRRNDMIIDGTLASPEGASELTKKLKKNGYHVEVHALTVKPEMSWLGVNKRFEKICESGTGVPRWVPPEIHDKAVVGMPESLERLEKESQIDKVMVFDRDNEVFYDSTDSKYNNTSASQTVTAEHKRQLTTIETRNINKEWRAIQKSSVKRNDKTLKSRNKNAQYGLKRERALVL